MILKTRYMTSPSESLILGATMVYGAEESKRIRSERRRECRLYLVREDLRPNPRTFSAWQRLFRGKSDGGHRRDMSQSEQG